MPDALLSLPEPDDLALLSLTLPDDLAQHVEDLLLAHPELVHGFTTSAAAGHGAGVALSEAAELVAGHAPRTQFRLIGSEAELRSVLALLKAELPGANLYYWLVPVIEAGRL